MPRHSPYALVRLNFLSEHLCSLACSHLLELLEFLNMDITSQQKGFTLFALYFPSYDKIVFYPFDWKDLIFYSKIRHCPLYLFFVLNFFALFDFQ